MPRMTLHELRRRRDRILELARKRGAYNVRVFGSVARGDATPESDVDFVVEFEPERSLLDHGGLLIDLEQELGCKVDVVSVAGLKPRVRKNVETEAVPL